MMRRPWKTTIVIAGWLFLTLHTAWATNAYVTDSFRISLRRGPTIENKILKFLPSGLPVEIIGEEQDGWSQVIVQESEDNVIKGWVLSRYLINRLPWKDQSLKLQQENEQLQTKLQEIEKSLMAIDLKAQNRAERLKDQSTQLEESQQAYQQLQKEAATYLTLKKKFESVNRQLQIVMEQNTILKKDQTYRWLGIGAIILLMGLIIGLRVGSRQEKNRSSTFLSL